VLAGRQKLPAQCALAHIFPPDSGIGCSRAAHIASPASRSQLTENDMGIGTILLVILVLALVGVLPTWPHSSSWGYGPSGGVGLILVVVLILFVLGKI
jgi:hypothetical protein